MHDSEGQSRRCSCACPDRRTLRRTPALYFNQHWPIRTSVHDWLAKFVESVVLGARSMHVQYAPLRVHAMSQQGLTHILSHA